MSPDIIATAIRAAAPQADAATWSAALIGPMQSSGITTAKRIAMFIGQCAEETGFRTLEENLNYSVEGLTKVWPGHFPAGSPNCERCAHKPEVLANTIYCDRLGNGDEASGDGWKFRGRGLIQLTGRALYAAFAHAVGRALDDDLLAWMLTPAGAARSACWYWTWAYHGRLLGLSDTWDVREATTLINGGLTNLEARVKACSSALAALTAGGGVATHITLPEPSQDLKDYIARAETVSPDALNARIGVDPDHSADTLNATQLNPTPAGSPATQEQPN